MRNVKIKDGKFVYDCDGANCATPDIPHDIEVEEVYAALHSIADELYIFLDPRTEALDVALTYLYQQMNPDCQESGIPQPPPYADTYKELSKKVINHYRPSSDGTGGKAGNPPPKKLLN